MGTSRVTGSRTMRCLTRRAGDLLFIRTRDRQAVNSILALQNNEPEFRRVKTSLCLSKLGHSATGTGSKPEQKRSEGGAKIN